MKTLRSQTSARAGFTLLEILVVVLIVGLLLGVVGTNVFKQLLQGQRGTVDIQIKQFEQNLNLYKLDNYGKFPDTLEDLTLPDEVTGEAYMDSIPLDPWQNEYYYEIKPDGKPLIISYGKDGVEGGEGDNADISNEDEEN